MILNFDLELPREFQSPQISKVKLITKLHFQFLHSKYFKMTGRSGIRGRRTRMYDCNYNMGQQYYKSALDNLDRKQSGV